MTTWCTRWGASSVQDPPLKAKCGPEDAHEAPDFARQGRQMDNRTMPQRALAFWHEDSPTGRLRRAVIVVGLLIAVAIALWPVSRSENIYKSVQNPQYKYTTTRVPSGQHRTVSWSTHSWAQ